jgi:hypothetical protein
MASFEGGGLNKQEIPIEEQVEKFSDIDHDQLWDRTVNEGIPLFKKLAESGDTANASVVRKILERTATVMERSGAGDEGVKSMYIEKIRSAVQNP